MEAWREGFHFPSDITLGTSPLVETWLDLRWQLQRGSQEGFFLDPQFPLALGTFYQSVRERFGYQESLPSSTAPLELLPHVVRYRFRPAPDKWPLLQLGPGVATVNFTRPYSWREFKEAALYLRAKLTTSYEIGLRPHGISLQYRNAVPCSYSSGDLLAFLKGKLNTAIKLPPHIPGPVGAPDVPVNMDIAFTYNLERPRGTGIIQCFTGTKRSETEDHQETGTEHLLFELRVMSQEDGVPDYTDQAQFEDWLESAHAVIHEWFFSLIAGPLFDEYHSLQE